MYILSIVDKKGKNRISLYIHSYNDIISKMCVFLEDFKEYVNNSEYYIKLKYKEMIK